MFSDLLLKEYKEQILKILASPEATSKHHSINIPFDTLFVEDDDLALLLIDKPEVALKKCNKQLMQVQQKLEAERFAEESTLSYNGNETTYKFASSQIVIHVRIYNLPACGELQRNLFPRTTTPHFIQISGTVLRISSIKLLEYERDYVCTKCKEEITISARYEQRYEIIPPSKCPNVDCNGVKLIQEEKLQACKDYQEIKMQEDVTTLDPGTIPNSMWVTLEDDLADICKPGDSITVCGIVKERWRPNNQRKKIDVELAMMSNHVSINNNSVARTILTSEMYKFFDDFWATHQGNELMGRDIILRSFCPQLFGMYMVKLAVAIVLAGGSIAPSDEHKNRNSVRTRTEPHLLLVGDPGTGKSQLLRQAAKIIPRSVMTTGIGTTSAGLTVNAIMEDNEWQLEAGALVLSDGGICCIDEFNSMREHDRMSIHEAMEQQTISVAKASIVCTLNTRCSILASANPKGPLDTEQPLSFNIAMASPLLSRFDLILLLKDKIDSRWDEQVADYILGIADNSTFQNDTNDENSSIWTLDKLQGYFAIIKKLNPILTPQTRKILSTYYQYQRKRKYRNQARTTLRLLDSLIRLSQAHAKLMYRSKVEIIDAVMAIALIESSMDADGPNGGVCDELFAVQVDFPRDPLEKYKMMARSIFAKLQLDIDINFEVSNRPRINKNIFQTAHNCEVQDLHEASTEIQIDTVSDNLNFQPVEINETEQEQEEISDMNVDPFEASIIQQMDDDNDDLPDVILNEQKEYLENTQTGEIQATSTQVHENDENFNLDLVFGEDAEISKIQINSDEIMRGKESNSKCISETQIESDKVIARLRKKFKFGEKNKFITNKKVDETSANNDNSCESQGIKNMIAKAYSEPNQLQGEHLTENQIQRFPISGDMETTSLNIHGRGSLFENRNDLHVEDFDL